MEERTTSLATKIANASKFIGGKLEPDKRNKEKGYDYIGWQKVLSICGQAISDQGLTIVPEIRSSTITYAEPTGKTPRYDATVTFNMQVQDSGDHVNRDWVGVGCDYTSPDKAFYKAVTSGHKYFLMKLFCIGEGEEEDGEHENPPENKPTKAPLYNEPLKKLVEVAKDMPQKMSLEMAKTFTSGDGKPYWDMEVADLVLHFNGLEKQIKAGKDSKGVAYTPQQIEEKQMKRDAITVILKAKQGK